MWLRVCVLDCQRDISSIRQSVCVCVDFLAQIAYVLGVVSSCPTHSPSRSQTSWPVITSNSTSFTGATLFSFGVFDLTGTNINSVGGMDEMLNSPETWTAIGEQKFGNSMTDTCLLYILLFETCIFLACVHIHYLGVRVFVFVQQCALLMHARTQT